jgi:hypothetical protein
MEKIRIGIFSMEKIRIGIFSWESLYSIRVGGISPHVSELSEVLAADCSGFLNFQR